MPRNLTILAIIASLAACGGGIYLRDGITDGDTFYLSQRALSDDDPVLQSWVSYSLTLAACKLRVGGDNPARNSSYDCELAARRHLLDSWDEHRAGNPTLGDRYLDSLAAVREAGWLPEYVVRFHGERGWAAPQGLDMAAFRAWLEENAPDHRPATRLTGSWNYARNVQPLP